MMGMGKSLTVIALAIIVTISGMSLFTVNEWERALLIRLGKLHRDSDGKAVVIQPGLRFKAPFVDTKKVFDKRIQTTEISSSRIPTVEKKQLIIDLFTKWRIYDFERFYTSTNGERVRAERLLREKIEDGLRAEVGRRKLDDVVSKDREVVMAKIRVDANKAAENLGIEVIDTRIMRIDLPQEVSEEVYNLMRAERNRIAAEQRAQGRSQAEAIRANADARVTVIKATAESEAKNVRGQGDAEAAEIFAKSFGEDPEFYRFYRSLEAYKETFKNKNDMLVIKPDDAFFKYFRHSESRKGDKS
jgi:membrane protease subunit HflC